MYARDKIVALESKKYVLIKLGEVNWIMLKVMKHLDMYLYLESARPTTSLPIFHWLSLQPQIDKL